VQVFKPGTLVKSIICCHSRMVLHFLLYQLRVPKSGENFQEIFIQPLCANEVFFFINMQLQFDLFSSIMNFLREWFEFFFVLS
jgi:fructose-specific phosphotransferase system IIC component